MDQRINPINWLALEQGVNQGVIAPTDQELQVLAGGVPQVFPVLAPDGNWDPFLSDSDSQIGLYFDTMGCNIFSSVHCCEAYLNALGKDPRYTGDDLTTEFSERKACFDAGVTASGSSEAQWESAISKHGLVKHQEWPFPFTQRTPPFTRDDFFTQPPMVVEEDSLSFLFNYDVHFKQIGTDLQSLKEALKFAPVKIFIATGPSWNNGEPMVIPRTNNPMGHAVMVRRIDDLGIHINDQYAPFQKLLAPDYIVFFAFQTFLTKKGHKMQIKTQDKGGELRIVLEASSPEQWAALCAVYGLDPVQIDENVT